MNESWIQDYALLAFRMNRVAQCLYGAQFVESYYGPPVSEEIERCLDVHVWLPNVNTRPERSSRRLTGQRFPGPHPAGVAHRAWVGRQRGFYILD
jgi:hypothetical protein